MEVKRKNMKKTIKSMRNLFKLKKENEEIRYTIIKDIRILFKQEDDCYRR